MNDMIPRFFVEKKDGEIKMIFPVPQRYELRTYQKSPRRSYSRIEKVFTPWLVLPIGKETARTLAAELKANQVKGEVTIYDCDNWFMAVQAVGA